VGSFILGRHYDCMNDTPMRALCGFVLWAESVIGTRIRAPRPADAHDGSPAVMVGRIATGELEEKRPSKKRPLKSQELSEPAMNPFSVINKTVICSRVIVSRAENGS
jgi:hypothetical protein